MQAQRQAAVHDATNEWAVAESARTIWQASGREVRSLVDVCTSSDEVANLVARSASIATSRHPGHRCKASTR